MSKETVQVEVTYGQDTACYYTETLVVPADLSEETMRAFLKDRAIHVANDEDVYFDPEYDFSNLRIVSATSQQSGKPVMLVEDMGVEPRYHDSGLCLAMAIKDKNLNAFFEAVSECGKTREAAIAAIAEFADRLNEVESNG
ncbi:MAG: hypothetical protein ACYCS8_17245 [Acidithiobacillus sp.]